MNTSFNFQELYNYAKSISCDAVANEAMSLNTSFKTGGPCGVRLSPDNSEQLILILNKARELGIPYVILGNGTNVLVPDEGINKAVIIVGDKMSSAELEDDNTISFSAGTNLAVLCRFALENSLSGLEFAFGIPGTCGGAVYMNAGAYGGEMKDVLTEVTHLTPDMKIETISAKAADLSYRHSVYKSNGCIILGGKVKLAKDTQDAIKARMNDFLGRRKDKQPLEYPSAGSTFKRPEGYFAGALIEQCNLKGKSVGGAQVSEKHAGFVINKGGATSSDILSLIELISKTVKEETGVTLEPEVIVLR
ncbi:MAG: UDP-N-acetylmuramate dehydrogenase [Clostridia bacterium]|nr:UDP-N-acetylmuramate dehydrogenase [Clostridia bacterium]